MVFSAYALEKKGDDDDPKAVEKKRFGRRRSVQFLEERLCRLSRFFGPRKRRLRDTYLLEKKKTLREKSSYFFFLEKTFFAWGVKETPSFLSHHHGK